MKSNSAMIPMTMVSIKWFLEPVAKAHVKRAHNEKHDDDSDEDEVAHMSMER
jgi:hypothetical protein